MDPTFGLADKFRDLVIKLIGEQLLYLISYGKNIKQLNERLKQLTLERSSLQHQIDEATNNVEKIEEKVLHWLHEVDEISEQVQKLHKEGQPKRECSITSCPNPWLRYKLSKRAKAIAQEVADICGRGNFDRVSYRVPPQLMLELTNRESNEGIDSRVSIMNQIMEALRNPSVNMIGLCGLGGVGKTTIAKEVAKDHKTFEKVIMVTISEELNIEKIQGQIAEKLAMQLNEKTEDIRASYLRKRLKQEKNMLLILDDLWEELDLAKVGIPFVEGCKILLTSRNEILLSKNMKCQKIIKVGVLLENEALELFKRVAELSTDSSSAELINIATEIVQKFEGLPLAIATAAKALTGEKDPNVWKDALKRLKNPLARSNTLTRQVDSILKLSYDRLSSFEYKHIFLLAAMLSHDPSVEDLLMYSVGLDILQHIENIEEAHVGICVIVSKLKSANLFLDSISSQHITIHDVFRDFALSIASDELHAFIRRKLKEWPDENKLEGCKGICLQESDISDLPEELHGSELEFFMLNSTNFDLAIPNMFFKSSKKLKVLAFTNVHFPLLPSLSCLKRLKALCLHSCLLENITEVRSLRSLTVLSLAYSKIELLPVELAELTCLQMLNLSNCSKLKVIPQKLLSSFKKLEVLYMENSFDQWKVEGSSEANENASLEELKDLPISSLDIHIPTVSTLPENLFLNMNLKRYKIFIGNRWRWQGNCKSSKIFRLELGRNMHLKRGVRKFLEVVEDLHLYGSNGLENVLYSQGGKEFRHLRHLQIENNHDIKYVFMNSTHHEAFFPILESFKLYNLNALEKLCEGPNVIVLPRLHTLKMKNLPALTTDLCIKDRASDNACNEIFPSLFNKVLLPKLEILELSHLNSLIPSIWDDQLSHNSFSNLKALVVKSCGFVKLVPLVGLKSLNNLEELKVEDCNMLENVFDFEDFSDCKEIVASSVVVPLKKIMLWKLPKLKSIWSNHSQGNVSFQCLRSIDVSFCESLTSVFPASIAKGTLHGLKELQISNCGVNVIIAKDQVLESVVATFEFPRLTSLKLFDLPNLRNFYPQRHILEWSLQLLSIQSCDELEILHEESSPSEIHEEESTLDTKYPLLSHQIIGDLEELRLRGKVVNMIENSQLSMYHFPKIKILYLNVDKATAISSRSMLKSFPNLEELELWGDFKEAIEGHDVPALAAPFLKLTLKNISNMVSLEPSLISSSNLTHLHVEFSHGLTTLMTPSTARSLVHLKSFSIGFCNQLDEIITKKKGEDDDDDDDEIIFSKLEFLKLDSLPKLKRFCSHNYIFRFPLLECVTISSCPQLTIFCPGAIIHTPRLQSVQLQKFWVKHEEIWDTNLNKTFFRQQYVESGELVLDENGVNVIKKGQFSLDHCPEVKILRMERFVDEGAIFPYTLLERFPQLNELHVKNSYFEEIFPSHEYIVDQIPPFKELYLANLDQLKNIWRNDSQLQPIQNLQMFHNENCSNLIKLAPSSTSFQNLMVMKVSRCHQLIYLLTKSTAKSLVNLETLEINDCKNMEEIVKKENVEDVQGWITFNGLRILKLTHLPRLKAEEDKRHSNIEDGATNTGYINIFKSLFSDEKVLLPKLQILELSHLNNLISLIWDDQISTSSFSNLRTLIVDSCGFVKLIPFHVLKSLNKLEELKVGYCDMLEKVFDFEGLNYFQDMEPSSVVIPLRKLSLWELPKLKNNVWSINHSQKVVSLAPPLVFSPNLTHLEVEWCHELTTLITSSTAQSLVNLTHLSIRYCDQIEKIVAEHEGEDDDCGDKEIFFNKLECLELYELPRMKMFCNHNYTFRLPLLKHVTVIECPRFTMFCSGAIHTPELQTVQVYQYGLHKDIWMTNLNITIQHRFTAHEVISTAKSVVLSAENITMVMDDVFPNVNTLYIESFLNEWATFPCISLERFPNLYQLYLENNSFEEIFPSENIWKLAPFDELYVANLNKLKSIWKDDSQLSPIHQDLTFLHVKSCCNLINLAPSSSSFENLRELVVSRCDKLIYLVTSSTAKSLVSLEALVVNDCEKMKETIKNDINGDVEGGITFSQLRRIELTNMPSLKMFSSETQAFQFPELDEIQIIRCHEMKTFCLGVLETPKLSIVKMEEHDMIWNDKKELNKTIEMLSSAKASINAGVVGNDET